MQRRQESGSEGEKKFKILVVDDEPDMPPLVRQAMRPEIRAGKYSFLFAEDGSNALEQLEEHTDVDMVVSDINMPRMDGLALLEQISTQNPDIRAIIVSAYGDMKNIRKAMNRGAFDFITKPLDFDDFRITIERARENPHCMEDRNAVPGPAAGNPARAGPSQPDATRNSANILPLRPRV